MLNLFGKSFPPCYSQSPLLTYLIPPPPPSLSKSGLKLVCNVNIVYGNLKSGKSQDYAQKPQLNCTSMNSTSLLSTSVENGMEEGEEEEMEQGEEMIPLVETVNQTQCCGGLKRSAVCIIS